MKKILLLFLLVSAACQAQVYNMQNGSFTVTNGFFYDSGGPAANYMANEDYTITFCPAVPGTFVQLDFSAYNTEAAPRDIFTIYEGSDIDGEIIGVYGAVSPLSCLGGLITSSDPNGCLTITFTSDNGGQYLGWAASIALSNVPGINEDLPLNSFCASGTKFCADTSVPFPNVTSNDCVPTSAGVVTENTCLLEAPNPVWHTIKIEQDGNLQLRIRQTSGPNGTGSQIDVDFALWGPYTDENAACGNLTPGNCTDDHNCTGNVVDCSFSISGQETATIPNAHAGEFYLLLVTNYEGATGYISMQQLNTGAGAGTTDCSVVCPQAVKTNPTKCGVADGSIVISGFKRNTFYNITYLYQSNPVAVALRSNTLGKIILSGLEAGTYSNIMTNYDDCTAPIGPLVLTETQPNITDLQSNNSVCSGGNAVFTLTGTPNAVVTYDVNGLPVQTTTLDNAGSQTVTVNNITAGTTLNTVSVMSPPTPVTAYALSVSGGENANAAVGNIAASGAIPTALNSASINGTNQKMILSLTHTVPAGTAITISLARNISYGAVNITDGVNNMTYNSGTVDVLQRITFTTAVATNMLTIERITGSVWIDGLRYSYTPSSCTRNVALSKTVTIGALPNGPAITQPAEYCTGDTPAAFIISALPGATLNWYTVPVGGTATTVTPVITTTNPGNTTYHVSQTLNACESARTPVTIIVKVKPPMPSVQIPAPFCLNETHSALTAWTLTGAVLRWYGTNQTGGTATTLPPVYSTALAGTQTFYVSQIINGCESERASIPITVRERPLAPQVLTPLTYCQNATIPQLSLTADPGVTLKWYATLTGGVASLIAPTPVSSTIGNQFFYVSQTVNGCESARAAITVSVTVKPAAPTVSSAVISYCQNEIASPLLAPVSAGTIKWYDSLTDSSADLTPPTPSTTTPGNQIFYVSQTVNGCESDRSAIAVSVLQKPSAPSVAPQISFCLNEIPSVLSSAVLSGSSLKWYLTNTSTALPLATAPSITTLNAGMQYFYVSQTVNGCESDKAEIRVQIKPLPAAPQVSDLIYCEGSVASPLSALASGTLKWYDSETDNTPEINAPTPTTIPGIWPFYVSQTLNGCESAKSLIRVIVNPKPSAPAIASPQITYCEGETAFQLQSPAVPGTLKWYNSLTDPTADLIAPTPIATVPGTKKYYVSQTANGCESDRSEITVIVKAKPTSPIVISTVNYCQNEPAAVLSATASTGGTLNWYASATGGSPSNTPPTVSTATPGSQLFYVSQTVNGCEGLRSVITVHTKVLPEPHISGGIICVKQSTGEVERSHEFYTGLNNNAYDFRWYFNSEPIPNANDTRYTAQRSGLYTVIAINTATGCESLPVSATVTNSFVGESIAINGNEEAFVNNPTIVATVTGTGVYEYQLDHGGFQQSNVFTNVSAGVHMINVRDANDCTHLSKQFDVVDFPKFFTPNGDGYNDTWSLQGLPGRNAKVYIFNRYGELVSVINSDQPTWDGKLEGNLLPATEYWFEVQYVENNVPKSFKSHFSLKR